MELAKDPFGVFALVMTPTRELAIQIAEQFRALSAGMSLKVCGYLNQYLGPVMKIIIFLMSI